MRIKPIPVFNKRILSFIPYKKVVVSTSLSLQDTIDLFSDSISPLFDPIMNPMSNSKMFQGTVSEHGFAIRATSYYRGSLSYVKGKFIPTATGVKIEMYVDPNPIFLLFPFILAGSLCGLLRLIAENDYIAIFACLVVIVSSILWPVSDIDNLDWFISNRIGLHLLDGEEMLHDSTL